MATKRGRPTVTAEEFVIKYPGLFEIKRITINVQSEDGIVRRVVKPLLSCRLCPGGWTRRLSSGRLGKALEEHRRADVHQAAVKGLEGTANIRDAFAHGAQLAERRLNDAQILQYNVLLSLVQSGPPVSAVDSPLIQFLSTQMPINTQAHKRR